MTDVESSTSDARISRKEKTRSPRIRRISDVIEFYTYILNAALGSSVYLGRRSRYGFWNEMLSKAYSYFTFRAVRRKKTEKPPLFFVYFACIKRRFAVRHSPRWFSTEEISNNETFASRNMTIIKFNIKISCQLITNHSFDEYWQRGFGLLL